MFSFVSDLFYGLIVLLIDAYKYVEKCGIELAESFVEKHLDGIFKRAGIVLNGPKKYDPQITNKKEFYTRVVSNATLGLGECYMERIWDVEDLEEFIYQGFMHDLAKEYLGPVNRMTNYLLFKAVNLQTKQKAWEVGEKHYDLGKKAGFEF
jgi:cyclopropane-fatty-acyl-phospholipid synthase